MTDKEKLPTEKQIAIYDMLDAKCTVTDEGVQGFLTWKQIRAVYNSILEEPVSEDLEDAACNFVMNNFGNPKEPLYKFDQKCFKAGSDWQKEQMMKEAVGAKVSASLAKELGVEAGSKVIILMKDWL